MKGIGEFLKATALGGLFVILPLLLLYLLIDEALDLIIALATPIADMFPLGTFDKIDYPVLWALLLIVFLSFLIGLLLRSSAGQRLGKWIEASILSRIPPYNVLKSLTTGFMEIRDGAAFRPAILTSPDDVRELVYVVEELSGGYMTILVPWSPTPFAGSVKIVPRDRIELLDTKLMEFTEALSHWGVGVNTLLSKVQNDVTPAK